ncbi:MAG: ATP-binding cassette domain-containing protein, partial [Dongiaceae bacterium]
MIAVEDLGVSFGTGRTRIDAVRGVSFTVAEGESFGLVGESGSGKSTVVGAVAGLLDHWSGAIALA